MEYQLYRTKKMASDKKNLEQAIELVKQNLESNKNDYKVYNIIQFGRLLEGVAYYHEVDEYYTCVGFEVEIETQFEFSDGKVSELERQVGFYSIWIGKAHPAAPITFEESYRVLGDAHRFDNGLGDHIEVTKILASKEEVQHLLNK